MSKANDKQFYCYEYPRPAVTVDTLVVTRERKRRVLLIQRAHDPYAGMWAIPGGFVEMEESLEAAARRELHEETGVKVKDIEQLHTFGDPKRDPRGRTISVVYLAEVDPKKVKPRGGDDAASAAWFQLDQLPKLAFDHAKIIACARQRLRSVAGKS